MDSQLKPINNSKIALEFSESFFKKEKATFAHGNVVNVFIVNELDIWSRDLNTKFTLGHCMLGVKKITKNADPDRYLYISFGIGFDARLQFAESNGKCRRCCFWCT